jgi:hypothetical protein
MNRLRDRFITLTALNHTGHPEFMIKLIFVFLISLSAFASPRDEAQNLLAKFQGYESVVTRMDLYSNGFMDLPYGSGGPLGEGESGRYDQDPLYRFDAFDCTTFVETVVSLALTHDVNAFENKMDEIRYENGEVDYLKRNHFPSLQWIPNNVRNGLLKEINHMILPASERKLAEAVINLPGWLKMIKIEEIIVPMATLEERQNLVEELHALSVQYSPIVATLDYLPISVLLTKPQVLKRIPHGTIVNFVRPNWDLTDVIGTHMNVSHQGFIFQRKEGTILRHASTTGKVMEIGLLEYLKKFENHPTLKGIHLMQVN